MKHLTIKKNEIMPFAATSMDLESIILSEVSPKKTNTRVPVLPQWKWTWLGTMRFQVRSLALLSDLRICHCHELWVGRRHGSDLALLWLWYRPADTTPIQPLAWESPYATGAALKRKEKKKANTIWYHLHVKSKIWHKWMYLQNRNRLTERTDHSCQGGRVIWGDIDWEFGISRCNY